MNLLIPVNWLREYLKTDVAAKTIASYLTLSGPSVERIEKKGDDFIFDVEVTTNRPDAFSIYGLAREANAILAAQGEKSKLVDPKGLDLPLEPDNHAQYTLDVLIKDPKLCPRFTAIILDNVKIRPSPAFIKNALTKSSIRPINNIVDITNYVMLELGQPMHAFDYDKILGSKMILRPSREGEKIKTIDELIRKLPKGAIVIEDEKRPIDLCGIMGGANSAINSRTKRVLFFVQAYDPITIRKTTQALAFRTDAAARFEKGIDLEGILPAMSRAIYLAKKTSGAKIASELIDIYKEKPTPKTINLYISKLNSYLGMEFEPVKAAGILSLLGFKVKTSPAAITATAPSWRTQDMETQEDLVEEIARVYGYHNLPKKLPSGQIPLEEESILSKVIELKGALKYLGLTEIISYSIISEQFLKLSGAHKDQTVELANPLTSEWQYMRPTVLISLADAIAKNQNISDNIKIFEVAKTYIKNGDDLPTQDLMLTIALQKTDFYAIKGIVENIFEVVKRKASFSQLKSANSLFEKELSAQVKIGDKVVGTLGMLNESVTDNLGVDGSIAAAELNLTEIYQLPATSYSYKPVPKYPPVIEDISAIVGKKMPIGEIIEEVKKAGDPLVKKVEILDIFEDEKLGENKKSVTLRLTYQKSSGTPTQEEVAQVRDKIISHLEKSLYAKVRK
ncbi:MAG: phenylalanine--tRNA ligase subunit beta [Candidatus Curtissbacteria bacterium]|nr:phenylalanine--tRNA ligase subunit beta [Candidatus Curtissbacteria bacterium]